MSYGLHAEETARALNDLIVTDAPHERAFDPVVLACRDHVRSASLERLLFLVGEPALAPHSQPRVSSLASRPLHELGSVLRTLPASDRSTIAPTDLLPGPPASESLSQVDRWRCAARNVTLANHELASAVDKPWVSSDAALWHLTGDIAAIVESLIVVDRQLEARSLLPPVPHLTRTEHRLVAGEVARLARWFGDGRASDLAYASPLTRLGLYDGPRIHMVHRAEDLTMAQRTLGQLLRPRNGHLNLDERSGIRTARIVATGQIKLADVFAAWAEAGPRGTDMAQEFRRRIPHLHALFRSTVRLVEAVPIRSPLVEAQQSEMLIALRKLRRAAPSLDALVDLNEATHQVTTNLGRALRREGMHRKNILVLEQAGRGLPRPQPITSSRDPFQVACRALADDPQPAVLDRWPTPVHREKLRSTLDRQPTSPPPRIRRVPDLGPSRRGARP